MLTLVTFKDAKESVLSPADRTELPAARQAGAARFERGAEVTLSLFPRHAEDRLCEPLMDWAVFIIDSPESKYLHIHKSSAGSYSPSADGCTRVLGMGGLAHSSPLQAPSVVNLACGAVGVRVCWCRSMGQCICGDIGAGDGMVTGERRTRACRSAVPGHHMVHPVLEGRSDLGKDRAGVHGRVWDRVYLQEGKYVGKEE